MSLYLIFILIGTLIVLFQVFLVYYQSKNTYNTLSKFQIENFENETNYNLLFPGVDEIKNKIGSEQYFNFFKELDAKARGFSFSFEDFKKTYHSSVMSIEENDKNNFTNFYTDIIKSIPGEKQSKLLIPNIKITKVQNIENSYPHTHQDIIVFDKSYFKDLENYNSNLNSLKNYQDQANTLIHEIVHIKQRQNPVFYDDLYRQFGFQSISLQYLKNNLQDTITSRIRLNPDELPHYRFWVWKNQVLPLVIYSSFDVSNINQVNYIGIDWNNKLKKKQLSDWNEYNEFFGISQNNYHPIEILAEYYSIYYQELIDKKNNSTNTNTSQGYIIFKNYIKNN